MLYCGIDLGLRPKTAMTFLSEENGVYSLSSEVYIGLTDEEIEKLIWEKRPIVTALDAPLSASMEQVRPAEAELRKMLNAYSDEFHAEGSVGSPFGRMLFPITYRGKYLLQRLQPVTNVIETHPLANFCFLENNPKQALRLTKRKQKDSTIQREILERHIENLPENLSDDQYDAVITAFLACVFWTQPRKPKTKELPKLYLTDAPFVVFEPQ